MTRRSSERRWSAQCEAASLKSTRFFSLGPGSVKVHPHPPWLASSHVHSPPVRVPILALWAAQPSMLAFYVRKRCFPTGPCRCGQCFLLPKSRAVYRDHNASPHIFLWFYFRSISPLTSSRKVFTQLQLLNSLTLMSVAFCKTQIPLMVPEQIQRVFNLELRRFQPSVLKSLTLDSLLLSGCVWCQDKGARGTIRHDQILLQSLLSAFTSEEPYVSEFLFDWIRADRPSGIVGVSLNAAHDCLG